MDHSLFDSKDDIYNVKKIHFVNYTFLNSSGPLLIETSIYKRYSDVSGYDVMMSDFIRRMIVNMKNLYVGMNPFTKMFSFP